MVHVERVAADLVGAVVGDVPLVVVGGAVQGVAGGPAQVIEAGPPHDRAVRLLLAKYPQYLHHRLDGPILAIELVRWQSWAAS